jgi:hypothetical protein
MATERIRKESFAGGPEPFSDSFSGQPKAGRVEVIYGVYAHSLPLGGLTVRQARAELQERMNIDPAALAVVDGAEVPAEHILKEGQVLNFVRPAGEKGLIRRGKGSRLGCCVAREAS